MEVFRIMVHSLVRVEVGVFEVGVHFLVNVELLKVMVHSLVGWRCLGLRLHFLVIPSSPSKTL